jgi:phospholipid/cholesterol/gamma-HCH transport system substrate-binding protein
MTQTQGKEIKRVPSELLAVLLIVITVGLIALCLGFFNRSFSPTVPVTLVSDRSGLVMEPYAKVKMRGVQVGHVAAVSGGSNPVSLQLDIDPDQIQFIPANVQARINATSLFGAKYVDLTYPSEPSSQPLAAGAILKSENVAVEVNTVFQNLVQLLKKIDPAKLNAILSAFADGVRGQGEAIGAATQASNEVLLAVNPRMDVVREDFRALQGVSEVYGTAANDIVDILSAASTTSGTVVDHSKQLDALLVNLAGFSRSGVDVLGPNKDNLVKAVDLLEPTTNLLMKYNPELTCVLVGANNALDDLKHYTGGGDGKSLIMDAQVLLGDDPYRYPDNLPLIAAKGGPGGKPGCGSLPDVALNWPVRALITDTGFGTGLDYRPNPGIGFPGWANYFPVTRGVPQPPSIRHDGPPAPGPVLGPAPYGAPLYGPGGVPLYPGLPPAPIPGQPPVTEADLPPALPPDAGAAPAQAPNQPPS